MDELSDKDLHCLARQLQSAWWAPDQKDISTYRLFYGCWFCKYSHECDTNVTMNIKKALLKLGNLTGVNVFPSALSIWRQFLPASIFIEYPEDLHYLAKHHPAEYQNFKKYLDELIQKKEVERSGR